MEVIKVVKIFFGTRYNYCLSEVVLLKINDLFFWRIETGLLKSDYFIRWNDIIRPISRPPDGDLIRFFDKDLSEDSSDKLYVQENVDSHLE